MSSKPEISIICPTFNEENFIAELLDFLVNIKPINKEIIIIDGGSTDKTIAIVEQKSKDHDQIVLLHNEKKIVPFALNLAIPKCRADIISRIDAHTDYAEDYLTRILSTFNEIDADIVGGPTRTRSKNDYQAGVAHAICTRFAIGGSKVHQENYRGYTDSVTFGAWRKGMFDTTGLFDTDLKRNQDDEFHYRCKSMGFKIYQEPEIKLWYYPRDTPKGLAKQYFQYGLYKPLVLKKIKSEIKLRHIIPAMFVLYIISLPVLTPLIWWYSLPFGLYLLLNMYFSFANSLSVIQKLLLFTIYPTIHLSYGVGVLFGLFKSKK